LFFKSLTDYELSLRLTALETLIIAIIKVIAITVLVQRSGYRHVCPIDANIYIKALSDTME